MIIYAFVDSNNQYFYIGKTKNLKERIRKHIYKMKMGDTLPKYNKFRKILRNNNQEINRFNIKKYKCIDPNGIEYLTENGLTQFCKNYNLQQTLMSQVASRSRKHHKKWLCD